MTPAEEKAYAAGQNAQAMLVASALLPVLRDSDSFARGEVVTLKHLAETRHALYIFFDELEISDLWQPELALSDLVRIAAKNVRPVP